MKLQVSSNQTKQGNLQYEDLQSDGVNPTPNRRFYGWLSRKVRPANFGITLLVAATMGAAALNHLVPKSPNRVKGVTARLIWYVQDGRLIADMHTLASEIEYIVTSDSQSPSAAVPTSLPMAGNVTSTTHKS